MYHAHVFVVLVALSCAVLIPACGSEQHGHEHGDDHDHSGHGDAGDWEGVEFASDWVAASERLPIESLSVGFTDQNGAVGSLRELADRPMAVAFFYSRCPNNYKCAAVISRLSDLQRAIAERGIAESVRLLAITFEPQFDTPERIRRYVSNRGFHFAETSAALRLDPDRHADFAEELTLPVSYTAGWVSAHGIELNLLDSRGRLARKYRTRLWENEAVIADLETLISE